MEEIMKNIANSTTRKPLAPEEKWESLTLANNFIFYKVMRHHPDACRHLIEILLGIKIDRIEMSNEESVFIDYDSHGIRLDVFVRGSDRIFDIEIQCTDTKDLAERSRYYQGVMDVDTLKSGQKYREMKTSHVIFICMEDIFKNELPICTFENICTEDGKTKLNDRAYKHFFIAKNCAKLKGDGEINEFFDFLTSNRTCGNFTSNLESFVNDAKHNTQWRMQYMTWERQRAYDHDAGFEEGAQANAIGSARNLLRMNLLTPEQISQAVSLPLEQVLALKEELAAEVSCEKTER